MMSCSALTAGQAGTYFEKERDYYTEHQSNFDRWHGTLAQTRGFSGEVSKEQFDAYLDYIQSVGRTKKAGEDCTFSAPKSVSLAMAKDEQTRLDMIHAHQNAVAAAAQKIELEYVRTRSNRAKIQSRNMSAAEFLHFTARPTERNNFTPDLDLHSHVVILSDTYADGKSLSVDYGKIHEHGKELGLFYRQQLAAELQKMGYSLHVTDAKQGFWELDGFSREVIEENSNRRADLLDAKEAHGITDMQKANQYTRHTKTEASATTSEILEAKQRELFLSGKVTITKNEGGTTTHEEGIDTSGSGSDSGEAPDFENPPRQRGIAGLASGQRPIFERLDPTAGVPDVPRLDVVQGKRRAYGVLSEDATSRLEFLQSAQVRNYYLLRQAREERIKEIDRITRETLETMEREKYAFSVREARNRIQAAGVLKAITEDEATKAMERARVVKLGQLETKDGNPTRDRYITTEGNLQEERRIIQRVEAGKGAIRAHVLTTEESRTRLKALEDTAKAEGKTDFLIYEGKGDGGEQAEAVHHIMSCQDQYVAVDGLAGTGKTAMMERLKWECDAEGITVRGACYTGKAASGLQDESGIESKTIHSFLNQIEKESGIQPPKTEAGEIRQNWDFSRVQHLPEGAREIWAVDEAGLVDNHLMDQLQAAAEARGAQVLLLGDPDQLPPVGAGTPMQQMEAHGMATARLTFIRRQSDKELLKAVQESVTGDTKNTFQILRERNDFHEIAGAKERRAAIVDKITAAPLDEYKKNLLLVSTNADRKAYNHLIRQRYIERGELSKGNRYEVTTRDREGNEVKETRYFSEGERIIFTKNDNRLDVKNGTLATITAQDGKTITAVTDAGKTVTIDTAKYSALDYSYSVTNYKAQGMTVTNVIADMSTKATAQTRNALYVDISRAKEKAIVYTDNAATLTKQASQFVKKVTSADFAKRIDEMERQGGITNNDRYHAPDEDAQSRIDKALASIQKHTITKPVRGKTSNIPAPELPPPAPERPQQTNETTSVKRASTPTRPNLSTTEGIAPTAAENRPLESPTSPFQEGTRPATPADFDEIPPPEYIPEDIPPEEYAPPEDYDAPPPMEDEPTPNITDEWEADPLEYMADHAPDLTALTIEEAAVITDQEFTAARAALEEATPKGRETVSPFEVTYARDNGGGLHILPYKAGAFRHGDRITYGQLAAAVKNAKHSEQTTTGRAHTAAKGNVAILQSAAKGTTSREAISGTLKGIAGKAGEGLQSVVGTLQDIMSIFDKRTKPSEKIKQGAKGIASGLIKTPIKVIADILKNPVTGILLAPLTIMGGAKDVAVGTMKLEAGVIQAADHEQAPQRVRK